MLEPLLSQLNEMRIILASSSKQRISLLTNTKLKFEVVPSDFEEDLNSQEHTFSDFVEKTAVGKLLDVWEKLKNDHKKPDIIIGADTMVAYNGRMYGKPKSRDDAIKTITEFTTVMKLKYHMRNHTGERPYVCTICGRGFTVNTILLRHMRVHSGERPYVCVTCGKAFSQSSTLNTHMKVHAASNSNSNCQERAPKFQPTNEQKYQPPTQNQQQDHNRLMQQDNRMMQAEPLNRMLQQQQQLVDGTRILADASQLLTDHRLINNEGTRLLVNATEPPPLRLLINDNTRLLTNDNRLITQDNRLINVNVTDNRLLTDNSRHLSVLDGSRLLTSDKYLTTYDPYQRGHL